MMSEKESALLVSAEKKRRSLHKQEHPIYPVVVMHVRVLSSSHLQCIPKQTRLQPLVYRDSYSCDAGFLSGI